jgi:signal peptidase I
VHTWPVLMVTGALWTCTLFFLLATAWKCWLLSGAVALVLSIAMAGSAALRGRYMAVTVLGSSMAPTYRNGDRVLVRRGSAVEPGQVVVLEESGFRSTESHRSWIIKRVIATPGDPVPRDRIPALTAAPEDYVPAGTLVLLGDNPESSVDSRQLGYYSGENIAGTVLRVLGSRGHTAT